MMHLQKAFVALALALVVAAPAHAHGPTPQTVAETATIARAPADVWRAIAAFSAIDTWHPGVAAVEATGGNAIGAERRVTLRSGGVIVESLDEYDAAKRLYSYRLYQENIEAIPVSFYTAKIVVRPSAAGSEVEWSARFYRADTGNYPPDHLNDAAAKTAMTTFLRAGLDALSAKLGAGN